MIVCKIYTPRYCWTLDSDWSVGVDRQIAGFYWFEYVTVSIATANTGELVKPSACRTLWRAVETVCPRTFEKHNLGIPYWWSVPMLLPSSSLCSWRTRRCCCLLSAGSDTENWSQTTPAPPDLDTITHNPQINSHSPFTLTQQTSSSRLRKHVVTSFNTKADVLHVKLLILTSWLYERTLR